MIRFAALLFAAVAWGQAPQQYTVEVVANGMRFADGPVWSLEDFLLFSDTVTDKQHKFTPGKGVSDIGSRPGGTAGNAYDEKGNLYTCEFRERRVTRTAKNGKVDVIAARFEGKRLNAPNDVVVRRDGNVYFTDPAFGNQEDTRELDFNGVFRVTPRGTDRSHREVEDAAQRVGAFAQRTDAVCVGFGRAVDSRLRSGSRGCGIQRSRRGLEDSRRARGPANR